MYKNEAMHEASQKMRFTLSNGAKLSVTTAGEKQNPALLLLHGFPSSANTFREIIPIVAKKTYVIAPDLPGYGESDILPVTSFDAYADAISELLRHLNIGPRFIYLHDFGAPVGLRIAMDKPELVLGLVIQNANAHRTGFGPGWKDTFAFWKNPTPRNEAAAMVHLTFKGTRDQYVAGLPDDVAKHISPTVWEEDWRVMSLPGHWEVQRDLIADYGTYAKRFAAIEKYLRTIHPPALMLWGRHDPFFALAETLSWMEDLPRMETHIFDGGHFLLETHAEPAGILLRDFIKHVTSRT